MRLRGEKRTAASTRLSAKTSPDHSSSPALQNATRRSSRQVVSKPGSSSGSYSSRDDRSQSQGETTSRVGGDDVDSDRSAKIARISVEDASDISQQDAADDDDQGLAKVSINDVDARQDSAAAESALDPEDDQRDPDVSPDPLVADDEDAALEFITEETARPAAPVLPQKLRGKRPKGWHLRKENRHLVEARRAALRGSPVQSAREDSVDTQSPGKREAAGILERLPGRRRAPHADPDIEADLRRQLELKVTYRAVAKALKPILAELAQRTRDELEASPDRYTLYEEYDDIQAELDERLQIRLQVLENEQLEESERLRRYWEAENAFRKYDGGSYQLRCNDALDDALIRIQHQMLSIQRDMEQREDSEATDDEDGIVGRRIGTRGNYPLGERIRLDPASDSRSRFFLEVDDLWRLSDERKSFLDVQKVHDPNSLVVNPPHFAVYDGSLREATRAQLNLLSLLDATEEISEREAKTARDVSYASATGLQALAKAIEIAPELKAKPPPEPPKAIPPPQQPYQPYYAPYPPPPYSGPPPLHMSSGYPPEPQPMRHVMPQPPSAMPPAPRYDTFNIKQYQPGVPSRELSPKRKGQSRRRARGAKIPLTATTDPNASGVFQVAVPPQEQYYFQGPYQGQPPFSQERQFHQGSFQAETSQPGRPPAHQQQPGAGQAHSEPDHRDGLQSPRNPGPSPYLQVRRESAASSRAADSSHPFDRGPRPPYSFSSSQPLSQTHGEGSRHAETAAAQQGEGRAGYYTGYTGSDNRRASTVSKTTDRPDDLFAFRRHGETQYPGFGQFQAGPRPSKSPGRYEDRPRPAETQPRSEAAAAADRGEPAYPQHEQNQQPKGRRRPGPRAIYTSNSLSGTKTAPAFHLQPNWSPFSNTMGPPIAYPPRYTRDGEGDRRASGGAGPMSPTDHLSGMRSPAGMDHRRVSSTSGQPPRQPESGGHHTLPPLAPAFGAPHSQGYRYEQHQQQHPLSAVPSSPPRAQSHARGARLSRPGSPLYMPKAAAYPSEHEYPPHPQQPFYSIPREQQYAPYAPPDERQASEQGRHPSTSSLDRRRDSGGAHAQSQYPPHPAFSNRPESPPAAARTRSPRQESEPSQGHSRRPSQNAPADTGSVDESRSFFRPYSKMHGRTDSYGYPSSRATLPPIQASYQPPVTQASWNLLPGQRIGQQLLPAPTSTGRQGQALRSPQHQRQGSGASGQGSPAEPPPPPPPSSAAWNRGPPPQGSVWPGFESKAGRYPGPPPAFGSGQYGSTFRGGPSPPATVGGGPNGREGEQRGGTHEGGGQQRHASPGGAWTEAQQEKKG